EEYGFIGNPVTKKRMDYIETWKAFEKFFKDEGHESVPRYPVVDRWRPDLFFTIASIQDFQRIDNGKMVMEYPADPLIVPQVCLRFNDIPNVGITGRHHTSFIMGGQHSFGNYWKDRCIELNYKFLHGVMGIPEDKLIYMEDVWSMPDFSQFGPCMETFSLGLELVNSVFSQFTKKGEGYIELPQKVIDVGWGHERLVWFSNGTFNGYEAVFGPVVKWLKSEVGLLEDDLFERYSKLAGSLDFDEVNNIKKAREEIATKLGVDMQELERVVGPMQAIYAITDHIKTLLFAVTDGGIPSNVGGGYNLRVLLRRSLGFMDEFNFDFDAAKIAEMHARFLEPLFPELKEKIGIFSKIFDVEEKRYRNTIERSKGIIAKYVKSGVVTEESMEKIYVSHGITPELIQRVAGDQKVKIEISDDFYTKITEKHMSNEREETKQNSFDIEGVDKTMLMFYEEPYKKTFESEVIKTFMNDEGLWTVLKETLFYPEGGGQPCDTGKIDGKNVKKVEKHEGIVFHLIENGEFEVGKKVMGEINWDRRYELMKMHTGTHILSGSARNLFGHHVWQAGAQKGLESSRIDLTHYLPFSFDDLEKIEKMSNDAIEKGLTVGSEFLSRKVAEGKYGFVLYQGGASPGSIVRVINIHEGDFIHDVEACGGTHLENTKEAQMLKIIKSERVQDGVNRVEFVTGKAALEFVENEKNLFEKIENIASETFDINITNPKDHYDVSRYIQKSADVFSVRRGILLMTIEKFIRDIKNDEEKIANIRSKINKKNETLKERVKDIGYTTETLTLDEFSKLVFDLWKYQKKLIEREMKESLESIVDDYLERVKKGKLIEIIDGDRKYMITLAEKISQRNKNAMIILANENGDIIAKSSSSSVKEEFESILKECEGSGGGKPDFCQGKIRNVKRFKDMFS
ncbi:MAG: alanine--tRNA ligase, partial [Candidatus Micrarchaeota archaeon]|nr:alanine--tRNA ligase [Candidatus Micrarchaeota archaeon]